LSAVETGLLTAARPEVSGTLLGRKPRPPTAARPTGCPHGLGKRGRTDSRTAAIRGAWAGCLLGKHREARRRARRLWRRPPRPCRGRGIVLRGGARSTCDG